MEPMIKYDELVDYKTRVYRFYRWGLSPNSSGVERKLKSRAEGISQWQSLACVNPYVQCFIPSITKKKRKNLEKYVKLHYISLILKKGELN